MRLELAQGVERVGLDCTEWREALLGLVLTEHGYLGRTLL